MPPVRRMVALWEIGNALLDLDVKNPHAIGVQIQTATQGMIKRMTMFRSHKARKIWTSKEALLRDVGQIKGISNFEEMMPVIDPTQSVRARLSESEMADLYRHASQDKPKDFESYVRSIKTQYAHDRLGKALDRSRHLASLSTVADTFQKLLKELSEAMKSNNPKVRKDLRSRIAQPELSAFSNMCLSLTSKENIQLYKRSGPESANSKSPGFCSVYNNFRSLLSKSSDRERARLRRVISVERLAFASDLISSLKDEIGVANFKERQKLTLNL